MKDTLINRVLDAMRIAPAPRVKLIYTEQGCFVNATLREQADYFVLRAAKINKFKKRGPPRIELTEKGGSA